MDMKGEFFCGVEANGETESLHDGLLLIRRRRPRIAVHLVRISSTQRTTPRLLLKERKPVARTAGVSELTKTRNFVLRRSRTPREGGGGKKKKKEEKKKRKK